MVSPPTRGWTLEVNDLAPAFNGFPAHAGMDREHGLWTRMGNRFPRPRGDGPFSSNNTVRMNTVSPPTRGWTLRSTSRNRWSCGFPAHAGMDRDRAPSRAGRFGFPRPRGDGPSSRIMVAISSAVSPPTRGWTRDRSHRTDPRQGFPAHAGMDRAATSSPRTRARFPRPRGDGPRFRSGQYDLIVVSPPTRGWTSTEVVEAIRVKGFPAHAGMDLRARVLCG